MLLIQFLCICAAVFNKSDSKAVLQRIVSYKKLKATVVSAENLQKDKQICIFEYSLESRNSIVIEFCKCVKLH